MCVRFNVSVSFAVAGLTLLLLADTASAQTLYFDTNGSTAGSGVVDSQAYSWESSLWGSASDGTSVPSAWVDGGVADFAAGTDAGTKSYTVTANSDHMLSGMNLLSNGGQTVTLNGTGTLTLTGGVHTVGVQFASQTLAVSSDIAGSGGLRLSALGSLALYGNNTYTGGTVSTGGQIFFFNNSNSFGTGAITFTGNSGQGMVNQSPTGYTLANPLIFTGSASSTNFATGSNAGTPGVNFSGAITLPAAGTSTSFKAGNQTTDITEFSGAISGVGNMTFFGPGTIILGASSANYTGTTTSSTTLKLAANDAISNTSLLKLSGGTLNLNGFSQNFTSAPLNLSSSSTIDFGTLGGTVLRFADSSAQSWSGLLNLVDFDPVSDSLYFGNSSSALTAFQLSNITFNGGNQGNAALDSTGKLIITASAPEPGAFALITALVLPVAGASRLRRLRH